MKQSLKEFEKNNQRDAVYLFILDLMLDSHESNNTKEWLKRRSRVDLLVNRLSDQHIRAEGSVDYGNTIRIINRAFLTANRLRFRSVIKFIVNDMISFVQSLRMLSNMSRNFPKSIDAAKEIQKLETELYLIAYAYMKSRDGKWRNILSQLSYIHKEQKIFTLEKMGDEYKRAYFIVASMIIGNELTNPYLSAETNEIEDFIILLVKAGPAYGFSKTRFRSAMMDIVQKYVSTHFAVKSQWLYHVTNIDNLNGIIVSDETWIRHTKDLNDIKDQERFQTILNEERDLLKNDANNNYVSFSLTDKINKQTIHRYAKSYKDAVVFEYDKCRASGIFYTLSSRKFSDGEFRIYNSPGILGKVIYQKDEMQNIWNKISDFIRKLERSIDEEFSKKALIKAANVCKMFYKDKKWEYENEVRVITLHSKIKYLNVTEDKEWVKFSPSGMAAFTKIYSNKKQQILKILDNNPLIKGSFEVSNDIVHYNEEKDKSIYSEISDDLFVIE